MPHRMLSGGNLLHTPAAGDATRQTVSHPALRPALGFSVLLFYQQPILFPCLFAAAHAYQIPDPLQLFPV